MKRVVLLLLIISFSFLLSAQIFDSITDARDGQVYKTVKIGTQWWMQENINFLTPEGSWYFKNDSINYNHWGRLYDWSRSKYVCPEGFGLPSDEDWKYLEIELGMNQETADSTGWRGTDQGTLLYVGGSSGFEAISAGYRRPDGTYTMGITNSANFWTSSDSANLPFRRALKEDRTTVFRGTGDSLIGYSVRCININSSQLTNDRTICYGDSDNYLIASGEDIKWYLDRELTNLLHNGDTFHTMETEIGKYEYYFTREIGQAEVLIDSASLEICSYPQIINVDKTDESGCNTNDGQITIITSDDHLIKYSINDGYNFQENSGQFNGLGYGNYPIVVMNSCGCKINGDAITIISEGVIPQAPIISSGYFFCIDNPNNDINVLPSQDGIITWYTDQGLTNVISIGESFTPPSILGTNSYYVTETKNNCESPSSEETIEIIENEPPDTQNICLVTIDLNTGRNLIAWEKSADQSIVSYNIYRETEKINEFEIIGTMGYNELSVFLDSNSNPETRQYYYKISAIDICGNESPYGSYHKPMFLQYVGSTGGVNLQWSDYEIEGGDINFVTYEIYKGSETSSLEMIEQVSARHDRYTDTDSESLSKKFYYRVAGVLENPCFPTGIGIKSFSEPLTRSMSNLEDNQVPTGEEFISGVNGLTIFPNPFQEWTSISFPNPNHEGHLLIIRDLTGKVVKQINDITENQVEINRGNLPSGMYVIELRGEQIFRGKIIID